MKKVVSTKIDFKGGALEHTTRIDGYVTLYVGEGKSQLDKKDLKDLIEALTEMRLMLDNKPQGHVFQGNGNQCQVCRKVIVDLDIMCKGYEPEFPPLKD